MSYYCKSGNNSVYPPVNPVTKIACAGISREARANFFFCMTMLKLSFHTPPLVQRF